MEYFGTPHLSLEIITSMVLACCFTFACSDRYDFPRPIWSVQKVLHFTLLIKAVAQRCSLKKVFLEISQNSQENTCARVSFLIKLQVAPAALLKKRLWHRRFLANFCEISKNTFFYRTPLVAAFVLTPSWHKKTRHHVKETLSPSQRSLFAY